MEDKHIKAKEDSNKFTDAILNSKSKNKVVVAGPGTGKTYLFQKILEGKRKALTLSFVNSLVEDLSLGLYGLSEVKTLHGYARSELGKNGDIKIFPKLSMVINEDHIILQNESVLFDELFYNREDESKYIEFYKTRRKYYGKFYGYADVIYALIKYLEANNDKVPNYDNVLVDEFQDFNKLEISLIDLLGQKSPILLAGDDDQALYIDLKKASPEFIRTRYSEQCQEYESFTLPFCRRCTRVIVNATNEIINGAKSIGLLSGRIDKKYIYYDDPTKDKESDKNPKIVYRQKYSNSIPDYIEKQIRLLAEENKKEFEVLIISPTNGKSKSIVSKLKEKGLSNIESKDKQENENPSLLDGLILLSEDGKGNLGWRIAIKHLITDSEFSDLIKLTAENNPKNIIDLISSSKKKEVLDLLKTYKQINNGQKVADEKLINFFNKNEIDPMKSAVDQLRTKLYARIKTGDPGIRKIPIKATTIQSSKGLSSDYVFITHFDDQYFIKNKDRSVSDQDIYNFLVALTRAKKKVFLISSDTTRTPTFLSWIKQDNIDSSNRN